jgi:hypothetical protein
MRYGHRHLSLLLERHRRSCRSVRCTCASLSTLVVSKALSITYEGHDLTMRSSRPPGKCVVQTNRCGPAAA